MYEKEMKKCFKLALKGEGKTSPNPMVGCVILDENGKEIANGYHKKCGEKHAEADALSKVETGHTLIVNLEPCSHYGKTPPCADLIIKKGIKRVVIAMRDVNPIVVGNGIAKLKKAGIEVIEGILEDEAKDLNEVFIKNMTEKKPFVAIKCATTLDGKIATKCGDSKWITSENARKEVQKIRNKYDAILTTSTTVINDNPTMNCRLNNGKNLTKIILDRTLKTDFNTKFYSNSSEKIFVIVDKNLKIEKTIPEHVEIIKCSTKGNKIDLVELFEVMFKKGIMSILVEAGGILNGYLIKNNLADKIYQFIAPKILCDNDGKSAFYGIEQKEIKNTFNYKIKSVSMFQPDILIILAKL